MSTKRRLTESETLEKYRVSIENAVKQSQIASLMTELGYDEAAIAKGKALLETTISSYSTIDKERDEESEAYMNFDALRAQLEDVYSNHRKIAKVVFRNDMVVLNNLELTGTVPAAYSSWLKMVKQFYEGIAKDQQLQIGLNRLKVTAEDLSAATALITTVETARAAYLKEKGESQDSTQNKDEAFEKLDEWMRDFYAVAAIALEDHPQLLESLGKTMKS